MKKSLVIMMLAGLMFIGFQTDGYAKKKKKKLTKEQKRIAKIKKNEKKIEKYLGTRHDWKPAAFKNIRRDMTCAQVAQVFKNLDCDNSSPFKSVSAGFGTASEYKFYFSGGKLLTATVVFGPRIFGEKSFNKAMYNVVQRKWGPIKNQTDIRWKNNHYENVKLIYNQTHWELELKMPIVDPGNVNLDVFDEASLRTNLKAFFGGRESIVPAFLKQYKYHMPWQEVKQIHPEVTHDPEDSINYSYVGIENHPLVCGLKLAFDSGLLERVDVFFHWQLPRDLFKQVSFEVMREKYGRDVEDEEIGKDQISVYVAKTFIHRKWSVNTWKLYMSLPKKDAAITAAKHQKECPRLKTLTASAAPVSNITGNWKLVAVRQGAQTAPMDDGKALEFTAQHEFKMKENGKVVSSNYYKLDGSSLYFTSSPGGEPVKKFGAVVSCENNKLVMTMGDSTAHMILEKN
ncbi:MAG: hypothetical protein GY757_44020 [bacterium]|nr:hypothetical protein [bacterium]